ncbi:hypothetical protein JTB14_025582 [Gonioctena quinquepunctata]|nr:hypothetical protein JTB14_025582 [Gonioctena quinquepunctata]
MPASENSLLSTLPYLAHWILGVTSGFVSDLLLRKKVFEIETIRKIMTCIGFVVPAVALLLLGKFRTRK